MQPAQAPTNPVKITGPREAIEQALHQGLVPNAHVHALHGLEWIEVPDVSSHAECEVSKSGCKVHRPS